MQLLLPALRADFALRETYVYADEPTLDCPISAFGGLADRWVSRESLEAWRDQTRAGFSLQLLPGDHFFLADSRPLLLAALSRKLAEHVAAAG
jgi:medium-chain acyl-[acyl-carrier-protein] hydrolase